MSSENSDTKFVEPAEVAERLRAGQEGEGSVAIVDVRDEDFALAHIPGALNVPTEDWITDADAASSAVLEALGKRRTVVFHCVKSRTRGPFCATKLIEFLDKRGVPEDQRPEVYVICLQMQYDQSNSFIA